MLAVIFGCKRGVYLKPGDRIALFCKIREIKNLKNPASFDYSSYMAQMGIFYKAYISGPKNVHYLGKGTIPFPYYVEERVKGYGKAMNGLTLYEKFKKANTLINLYIFKFPVFLMEDILKRVGIFTKFLHTTGGKYVYTKCPVNNL